MYDVAKLANPKSVTGCCSPPIFRARLATVHYFEYEDGKAFRKFDNYLLVSRIL
jgi:hypothetical protein